MGDKYCRLATLLVEICPQPLRKLFLKYMYADTKFNISSLGAYLLARQKELLHLKSKKVINQKEWDLLFPKLGQADETTWDTTILALLITKLFHKQLKQSERDSIEEIRYIRNQLHHKADLSVSDADFDDLWKRLETATILLAKQITPIPQYAVDIKASIDDAMVNNLPKLGDTLRSWIPGIVKSLSLKISNLEDDMNTLKENTEEGLKCSKESQAILENSSVQTVGSSGRSEKRLKTCDNILISLNRMFKTTLHEKLPTYFETPPEVQSIKAKLRQNGHVVVTGPRGSRVLETALATVKDLSYSHDRCVEIKTATDWRHVDREEVDLVLCTYPFGDSALDYKKAADMHRILHSMLEATKPSAGKQRLYILIVSDEDVLQKFTSKFHHKLQAAVVRVCQTTSEEAPVDLTYPNTNYTELDINPGNQNLLDMSVIFVENYKKDESTLSESVVEAARKKFKQHKAIIIVGPRKCGKTTLAALLTSIYQPGEFLIIYKADDMKFISLDKVCLVVVEDFAGKYRYDNVGASDWMRAFDMLSALVKAGKLNVILTCEDTYLAKCKQDFDHHPMFDNVVHMKESDISTKEEKDENVPMNLMASNANARRQLATNKRRQSAVLMKPIADPPVQTFVFMHFNTTELLKNSNCRITELSFLAVHRDSFKQSLSLIPTQPKFPRVKNKLTICFNPDRQIQHVASNISGLTNENLSNQQPFTLNTLSLIKSFLTDLRKPFCFVAHNGNAFDFKVLKAEWKRVQSQSASSLNATFAPLCGPNDNADSDDEMNGFDDEATLSAVDMEIDGMLCADTLIFLRQIEDLRFTSSLALRQLFQELFGKPAAHTQTAEGYCNALLTIIHMFPRFKYWVDKNRKRMLHIDGI